MRGTHAMQVWEQRVAAALQAACYGGGIPLTPAKLCLHQHIPLRVVLVRELVRLCQASCAHSCC